MKFEPCDECGKDLTAIEVKPIPYGLFVEFFCEDCEVSYYDVVAIDPNDPNAEYVAFENLGFNRPGKPQ